ncbi:hypothetical protein [Bifidobacterium oedipodis]|uniref:Replication-associated protein n=1 Tax=Bifidobacterium oedipodis TaxID=2675322 RepID=A0A7Y0HRL9_9BIFI|nr:hypothetical protein [Bifidobacterium sp. DSM 109957]NMM94230.1 replication-associated protein [Bifidobacterium sp. DSM 109957]
MVTKKKITKNTTSTSESPRHRDWLVTIPYDRISLDELAALMQNKKATWIASHEKGGASTEKNPNGYEHWQLFFQTANALHFTAVKKYLPAGSHIEARRGSVAQAVAYCSKSETRIDGPYGNKPEEFQGWKPEGQKMRSTDSEKKRQMLRNAIEGGMSYDDLLSDDQLGLYASACLPWIREIYALKNRRKPHSRNVQILWVYGNDTIKLEIAVRRWLDGWQPGSWSEWLSGSGLQPGISDRTETLLVSDPRQCMNWLPRAVSGAPLQVHSELSKVTWAAWTTVVVVADCSLYDLSLGDKWESHGKAIELIGSCKPMIVPADTLDPDLLTHHLDKMIAGEGLETFLPLARGAGLQLEGNTIVDIVGVAPSSGLLIADYNEEEDEF